MSRSRLSASCLAAPLYRASAIFAKHHHSSSANHHHPSSESPQIAVVDLLHTAQSQFRRFVVAAPCITVETTRIEEEIANLIPPLRHATTTANRRSSPSPVMSALRLAIATIFSQCHAA